MIRSKHAMPRLTRRRRVAALALAVTAVGGAAAAPSGALASGGHPNADGRLVGTWVNTNPSSPNVKQIVIAAARTPGDITVDMFGSCQPTACEWGRAPAIVYGPNVSSTVGKAFQIDIDQGFARRVDVGVLKIAPSGAETLSVKELNMYTDGSGRHDWVQTETFAPAGAAATSLDASSVTDYQPGLQPTPNPALVGTWHNVNPATNSLTRLVVSTASDGSLLVHQYGKCSPSDCDNGTVAAITLGKGVSSTAGKAFLAPFEFGFARQQLVAAYDPATGRLEVRELTQFLDGSGRSNYAITEQFVK